MEENSAATQGFRHDIFVYFHYINAEEERLMLILILIKQEKNPLQIGTL